MNETHITSGSTPAPFPHDTSFVTSCTLPVILLVEDENFVREVTADILEFEGFRVFRARNAHEAKDAFHRYGGIVQLLVTDVVLPGQNGVDLARELCADSPSLRVLFISGFPENNWTRQEHREGENLYLPKPFSAESLLRAVRSALLDLKEVAI